MIAVGSGDCVNVLRHLSDIVGVALDEGNQVCIQACKICHLGDIVFLSDFDLHCGRHDHSMGLRSGSEIEGEHDLDNEIFKSLGPP